MKGIVGQTQKEQLIFYVVEREHAQCTWTKKTNYKMYPSTHTISLPSIIMKWIFLVLAPEKTTSSAVEMVAKSTFLVVVEVAAGHKSVNIIKATTTFTGENSFSQK